jgi:hypothetical protein
MTTPAEKTAEAAQKKHIAEAQAAEARAKVEPAARRLLRKLHSERGAVFTRADEDRLVKSLSTGKLGILKAITAEDGWQDVAQGVLDQAKQEATPEAAPEAEPTPQPETSETPAE